MRLRVATLDNALHAIGGAALYAAGAWLGWPAALLVVLIAVFGVAREALQHFDDDPVMTPHRWAEAASWGAGALLGWAAKGILWTNG